jgi:CMP-N,N'-diacetyllegionaminic acid synthase
MKDSKVIAIIPVRSGSKGLTKKNIQLLGGKPLVAWTIEAALNCDSIERVLVTTDSSEIADIGISYGADAPFLRPAPLANDSASIEDALLHAMHWLENIEGSFYDIVVLLQATDVFRSANIISKVVDSLIRDPGLDTALAVKPDFKNYWMCQKGKANRIWNHKYIPRQVRTPLYREDTGVALASRSSVIKRGRRVGDNARLIEHEHPGDFIDIHTEFDLWLANVLIESGRAIPNT